MSRPFSASSCTLILLSVRHRGVDALQTALRRGATRRSLIFFSPPPSSSYFRALSVSVSLSTHTRAHVLLSYPASQITSTSNCTDYQSRRLNIRYQIEKGAPPLSSLLLFLLHHLLHLLHLLS